MNLTDDEKKELSHHLFVMYNSAPVARSVFVGAYTIIYMWGHEGKNRKFLQKQRWWNSKSLHWKVGAMGVLKRGRRDANWPLR